MKKYGEPDEDITDAVVKERVAVPFIAGFHRYIERNIDKEQFILFTSGINCSKIDEKEKLILN